MQKKKLILDWHLPTTWLRFFILILLVLGIFFRIANLDRKVYSFDEIFTSIRISGYTEAEAVQQLSETNVIEINALQKYQHPSPEKSLIGTVEGLAVEEPQLTPLYFAIARFWAQAFGSSVAVTRSLPALISLLAFPCIYWLCLELFESSLIGWMAVALMTISPFHVLFAQEARSYSLWTVIILLSSATLLRAMRLKTTASWVIYAVTLVLSFYSFLFSLLVAIGHGIYVTLIERFRFSKTLTAYLVALSVSILAFAPWILVVITNRAKAENATAYQITGRLSLSEWLLGWFRNIGRFFIDFNPSSQASWLYRAPLAVGTFALSLLVLYSLYYLCIKAPKSSWFFVLTLIGTPALALTTHDFLLGGFISILIKYLTPCSIGFQLAVAYLLATKITSIPGKMQRPKLWQIISVLVVTAGVLSCAISFQAKVWWNKGSPEMIENILTSTTIINQAPHPLLISDNRTDTLIFTSYLLNPKVRYFIRPQCYTCSVKQKFDFDSRLDKIGEGFSDVFLYTYPSEKLLRTIKEEQKYTIKSIISEPKGIVLGRLEKT